MRVSKEAIAADLLGRYQITELSNGFIRVSDKVSGLEHLVKSGERMPSSVRSRLQFLQGYGSTPEQYMETLRDAARREFTPEFSKMVLDAEKFHSGRAPSPAGVSLLAPTRQRAATTHAEAAEARLAERGYGRRQPGPLDKYLKVVTPEESARTRAASEGWSEAQRSRRLQRSTARGARGEAATKGFDPLARIEMIESDVRRGAPHLNNQFQRERARSMLQMIAEEYPSLASRAHSALSTFNRLAPKALATGVAAKLMLGGAAKAAGLPGVGEAVEMAGREDPSLQQFFRETEEGITGALGLPQRSQMPVYSMDPAREGAARVMLRTGRQNLRPGFDEPAITKQELEYVKKKAAPRAK